MVGGVIDWSMHTLINWFWPPDYLPLEGLIIIIEGAWFCNDMVEHIFYYTIISAYGTNYLNQRGMQAISVQ